VANVALVFALFALWFIGRVVKVEGRLIDLVDKIVVIQTHNTMSLRRLSETNNVRLPPIEPVPPNGGGPAIQELRNRLLIAERRLQVLERTLVDSPAKALEVPLLKKDIESVARDIVTLRDDTRRSIDSYTTLIGWLVGIIGVFLSASLAIFFVKRDMQSSLNATLWLTQPLLAADSKTAPPPHRVPSRRTHLYEERKAHRTGARIKPDDGCSNPDHRTCDRAYHDHGPDRHPHQQLTY
jgi:hypothetical protein